MLAPTWHSIRIRELVSNRLFSPNSHREQLAGGRSRGALTFPSGDGCCVSRPAKRSSWEMGITYVYWFYEACGRGETECC